MASRRTPLAKEALRKAGQFDAESVKRVDLSSASLVSLSGLEDFSGLVALCVDDNKLTSLNELKGCMQLSVLSARNNNIVSIGKLPALPELTDLDLSGNSIDSLDALVGLASFPNLRRLQLAGGRGNSVCKLGAYEEEVMAQLPALQELDGRHVAISKALDGVSLPRASAGHVSDAELRSLGVPPSAAWLPRDSVHEATRATQAVAQEDSKEDGAAQGVHVAVSGLYDVSTDAGVQIARARKLLSG